MYLQIKVKILKLARLLLLSLGTPMVWQTYRDTTHTFRPCYDWREFCKISDQIECLIFIFNWCFADEKQKISEIKQKISRMFSQKIVRSSVFWFLLPLSACVQNSATRLDGKISSKISQDFLKNNPKMLDKNRVKGNKLDELEVEG